MEGIINVTPEQLISTSSEFSSQGTVIQQLTTEMMNKVTSLSSVWEGESANLYIQKFTGLQDDIQRMLNMVREHAADLQEMAQNYMNAENQNLEDFGSLSSDVIQ